MKKNSHPVKVVEIKDYEGLYANSHPYQVEIEGGGGGETYNDFTGATASTAGEHGLVPAPKAGDNNKYLKGDGTWAEVSGGGGSGIPTDATFWGASYDSTNNRVLGDIKLSANDIYLGSVTGDSAKIYPTALTGNFRLSFGTSALVLTSAGATTIFRFPSSGDAEINRQLSMSGQKIISLASPTNGTDAANKNYVDNLTISYATLNGSTAPTTATEGKYVGQLYYDTTNETMYYLKAIDTTTTPATYTWETLGGGSSGIIDLNYSEYNPTGTTTPTLSFGEWLYSKNLQAGTIVRMHNDTATTYVELFIGQTNDTGENVSYSLHLEPAAFLIYQNMKGMPGVGDQGYFSILSFSDSFDLWQWTGTNANPIQYFYVRHILTSLNIKGTGEMGYSSTDILSAESGNAISLAANASTNISGLTKVDVEPLQPFQTLTFNQTMEPWDFEWRGTAELDSSSPYDFSTASTGDSVAVYIRDTNGVPLNYLNPYEESYELTDTNGNTITVSGTLKDGGTAKIRIGHIILLQKYDDGWYFTSDGYDATYLPRAMEGAAPYTPTEFNTLWENA